MAFDFTKLGKKIVVGQTVLDTIYSVKKLTILSEPQYSSGPRNEYKSSNPKLVAAEHENQFAINLNLTNGYNFDRRVHNGIFAYDESIAKYIALEGKATNISFAMINLNGDSYDAICEIDSIFVTRSSDVHSQIKNSVLADEYDVGTTTNREISEHKRLFLEQNAKENSILLIDGPLLAGDGLTKFITIVESHFIPRDIIPIFVVKNSNSPLICDSWPEYKGKYNSDLHLIHSKLKAGQRTQFFIYTDESNKNWTKAFCYIKFRERYSPIRIEIPTKIFYRCVDSKIINDLMDLIYYYIMVQGSDVNPQPRPISIAEKFARESLSVVKLDDKYNNSQLTQTMNERRGMYEE